MFYRSSLGLTTLNQRETFNEVNIATHSLMVWTGTVKALVSALAKQTEQVEIHQGARNYVVIPFSLCLAFMRATSSFLIPECSPRVNQLSNYLSILQSTTSKIKRDYPNNH